MILNFTLYSKQLDPGDLWIEADQIMWIIEDEDDKGMKIAQLYVTTGARLVVLDGDREVAREWARAMGDYADHR